MINKSNKLMIVLIAIFAALPPFAIDTYSPAVPNIAHYFNILPSATMMTFTTYFIGFSAGIILWGPLSDVFGRKRILWIGAFLYVFSSILCSLSKHYLQLEIARCGQGFGDAACVTVAFAIARDCFSGIRLTRALATLGTIMMVAPIIAPSIGVLIMHLTNRWQDIFHFLTAYGLFLLMLCFIVPETMKSELRIVKVSSAFSRYKSHLVNYKFMLFVILAALSFAASFSFIGASAVLYLKVYGTSKLGYALLFAMNGFIVMFANFVLRQMTNTVPLHKIRNTVLTGALASSVIGCTMVHIYPASLLVFACMMSIFMLFNATSANVLTSIALNEINHSFGVASSINNSLKFICAGIANYIMSDFALTALNRSLFTQQLVLISIVASALILATRLWSKATTHAF